MVVYHEWAFLALAAGVVLVCEGCVSKLTKCQSMLFEATTLLQSGDYDGYCRESEGYINCVVADLTSCDQRLYNVTTLTATTTQTRNIYCPSATNPGFVDCTSRVRSCQSISDQTASAMSNTTAYCGVLAEYLLCVDRDITPCDQTVFNTTTLTSDTSNTFRTLCSSAESDCATLSIVCGTTYYNTSVSVQNQQWDQYCRFSEEYLTCSGRLNAECDVSYQSSVTSSQLVLRVKNDRARYCSVIGDSPTYHWCFTKHKQCSDLIYITGSIENTVVIDYCKSLDKYKKCISRDLETCQHDEFRVTRLDSEAETKWTKYCQGVNINGSDSLNRFGRTAQLLLGLWLLIPYI